MDIVTRFDLDDVVVFRHRPIGPEHAVPAVVNWIFAAKSLEVRPESIAPEKFRIADIEVFKRCSVRYLTRGISFLFTGGHTVRHNSLPPMVSQLMPPSRRLFCVVRCRRATRQTPCAFASYESMSDDSK